MLEKTLESPLDCIEIQPVHPKGDQSWIFIGRTDADAETPILWPPDRKNWLCCWERLRAGGEGDDRGWDGWMASPIQWTWVWVHSRSWWLAREAWRAAAHGVAKSWTWLSDWIELIYLFSTVCWKNFFPSELFWYLCQKAIDPKYSCVSWILILFHDLCLSFWQCNTVFLQLTL